MKLYEFNLLTLDYDVITLDDLITNMDNYDSSVYQAANDDYYGGVIPSTGVLN